MPHTKQGLAFKEATIPTHSDRQRGKHKRLFDALMEASKKGKAIELEATFDNRLALTSLAPTILRHSSGKKLRRFSHDGMITAWLVDAKDTVRKF